MAEDSACVIQFLSLSCENIAYPWTSEKQKQKQPFVDEVEVREKQYYTPLLAWNQGKSGNLAVALQIFKNTRFSLFQ